MKPQKPKEEEEEEEEEEALRRSFYAAIPTFFPTFCHSTVTTYVHSVTFYVNIALVYTIFLAAGTCLS